MSTYDSITLEIIQSSLQANCKSGIETAKKANSTQLSAPK